MSGRGKKGEVSNTGIPPYAVNPLFNIVKYDWFFFILQKMLQNDINFYVVYNEKYSDIRKDHGKFLASLKMKKMIKAIESIKDILMIGEYTDNKIFIIAKNDINDRLKAVSKNTFTMKIGATASLDNDNAFIIADRAIKALDIAQKTDSDFQIL